MKKREVRLLRTYGDRLGYGANFTIYDADDQKRVVKGIMKEVLEKVQMQKKFVITKEILCF